MPLFRHDGRQLELEKPTFAVEKPQDKKHHDEIGDPEQEGGQ